MSKTNHQRKPKIGNTVFIILLSVMIVFASAQPGYSGLIENKTTYKYETVTDFLGITRADIIQWLSMHENDDYYLGTPYAYRTGDVLNDRTVPFTFNVRGSLWGLWPYGYAVYPYIYSPNGDVVEGGVAQMNCGGFVHHVLTHAQYKDGTENQSLKELLMNLERTYDPSQMSFAGAVSIYLALYRMGVRVRIYDSIESMLASGILEKGDMIIIDGIGDTDYEDTLDIFGNRRDWHIGFFWGDTPDENLFWHSYHETVAEKTVTLENGRVLTNPSYIQDPAYAGQTIRGPLNDPANREDHELYGNIISRITAPGQYFAVAVFKFGDLPEGWRQNDDGTRSYISADGSTANSWNMIDGSWYYFENAVMCTGQKIINGRSFEFAEDGTYVYPDKKKSLSQYGIGPGRLLKKLRDTLYLEAVGVKVPDDYYK